MEELVFLGRQIFDGNRAGLLLLSLGLDALTMALVVGVLYFRQTRDSDHTFMMTTLNLVVFLIGFFMHSVEVGVGFGFGLFAIFGVVRYRTESVPVREMSYLFAVIALGLINAIGATSLTWVEVVLANATLTVTLTVLSQVFWRHRTILKEVIYDQLDYIVPGQRPQLLQDLWQRTGFVVSDVEVMSVNLLNETAVLRLTCPAPTGRTTPALTLPGAGGGLSDQAVKLRDPRTAGGRAPLG